MCGIDPVDFQKYRRIHVGAHGDVPAPSTALRFGAKYMPHPPRPDPYNGHTMDKKKPKPKPPKPADDDIVGTFFGLT